MNKYSELEFEIFREYSKRSLYKFFKLVWGEIETSPLVDNWHIEYICNILQQRQIIWEDNNKIDKQLEDILINICPSSSKSLIVSVVFPAWLLLRNPTIKILNATYSFTISERLASKRLRLFTSDLYQGIMKFKIRNQSLTYFENNKGGLIFSTSVGGALTGTHFDVLLIDDPNSPLSIYSESSREEAKRFTQEILPSRKTDVTRSYTIYVQQRFHIEDVSGVLLTNKNKLKHIVIPAINENDESFFPSRFPVDYFTGIKEQLGSIQYNAQYMQITQDESGGIIKKDWIKEIDGNDNIKLTYFIDTAYGNKTGKDSDDNAIIGVYKDQNNLIIQMCERNKYEFPELLTWIKNNIPNSATIYIEAKASGKSVSQMLRNQTSLNVIEVQNNVGKTETKHTCSPFFESGKVFINKYINNKQLIIEQLIFDNPKHDDVSDTIMMAINKLLKNITNKIIIR